MLCRVPCSGASGAWAAPYPVAISWLSVVGSRAALRLRFPQPLPVRVISFARCHLPAAVGCLCPPVLGWWQMPRAGPLRTRIPGQGSWPVSHQGQAGAAAGLPRGSPSPWALGPWPNRAQVPHGRIKWVPFCHRLGAEPGLVLHLISCLLFWMPRFECAPNDTKINFLGRCHKRSAYWEGSERAACYSCLRELCGVLYLALCFPCAAAVPCLDKAASLTLLAAQPIPGIGELERWGAELSKGFCCLLQTQSYLGCDLSRAGKNARTAAVPG